MGRENFLKAEEIARSLAETLVKLKAEIDLFKTTSDNLRDVRESLKNIVSMLEEVARGHFKVVDGFLGLKGPEIVEKLERSEEALDVSMGKLDDLENVTGEALKRLEELSGRLESMGEEYRRSIKRAIMLIYFVLALSGLSAIFAFLAFLR
ncbi:MAG: hypothetical protein J7K11_01955 [Candidatus Hydrothermae bacterium]|nr:hypothetical protein [Candidatus Hydrothermae bacterium]